MARFLVAWGASLAALSLATGVAAALETEGGPEIPRLAVTGSGKVLARPDIAEVRILIMAHGETAKTAIGAGDEALKTLITSLKPWGVTAEDVCSVQVGVDPRYAHPAPAASIPAGSGPADFAPKLVGFQVGHTVRVIARDLVQLGPILDALSTGTDHHLQSVDFRFEDPETLLDQARRRALADARRKAELLAAEAGMVLDSPLSIHEIMTTPAPAPPVVRRDFGHGSAATDIAPLSGARERELRSTIEVIYKIRAPKVAIPAPSDRGESPSPTRN